MQLWVLLVDVVGRRAIGQTNKSYTGLHETFFPRGAEEGGEGGIYRPFMMSIHPLPALPRCAGEGV